MALQLSRQHPPRPVWALSAIEPLRAELGLPAGSYVIGTAMHVAEGFAWRDTGADAIAAHFGDRVITGRHARGIRNLLMQQLSEQIGHVAPYPVQNALTPELRRAASQF